MPPCSRGDLAAEAMTCARAKGGKLEGSAFRFRGMSSPDDRSGGRERSRSASSLVGDHANSILARRSSAFSSVPAAMGRFTSTPISLTRRTKRARSRLLRPIFSRSLVETAGGIWRHVAVGTPSASVFLSVSADRMRFFARVTLTTHMPGRLVGVSHDAASSPGIGSRYRRASTISGATRRQATFARAGSPRRDRIDVCRLSGSARTARDCESGPCRSGKLRRACGRLDSISAYGFSTLLRSNSVMLPQRGHCETADGAGQTCACSGNTRSASHSMRRRTNTTLNLALIFRGDGARFFGRRADSGEFAIAEKPRGLLDSSPIRSSTPTRPRRKCCAICGG